MSVLIDYRNNARSELALSVGWTFAYALLVCVVLGFLTTSTGNVSVVWLPSGLGLAASLICGKKMLPFVFLGALLGYVIMLDRPFWVSAFVALGSNTLEPLVALWLLKVANNLAWRFDPSLSDSRDYLLLSIAGGLSASLSGLNGCTILLFAEIIQPRAYLSALTHWWMGDFLGLIVVTPLVLIWRRLPVGWFSRAQIIEAVICFGLAFLAGQVIFLGWFNDIVGHFAKGFFMFVFVAWGAVRFGRHGTILVSLMAAIQGLLGAIREVGYFSKDYSATGLINFWFFIIVLTSVGMALAMMIEQRIRIEATLRASENRFRNLTDFLPQQVWIARPDGSLEYVNRRVTEFLGRTSESMLGDGWRNCVHPDDLPKCIERMTDAFRAGKPYELDYRLIDRSGEYRWYISRALPLFDEEGNITKWYGTNTDITLRKQTEEKMRRSETRYRLLTENMKDVVWVLDAETMCYVYVSPSVEGLRGFTPEELMSAPALDRYSPRDRELVRKQISERVDAFSSGRTDTKGYFTDEIELPCKNGSKVWVEMISRFQLNEDTGHVEIHGVTRDISVRKLAEEEMKLASLVYQNSSEGMMVTDGDNNILTINPAFTSMTGYTAEEVIGKKPSILNSGRHDEAFFDTIRRSLNTTGRWQGEIWNRRKNGEIYAVWSTINTAYNEDGSVYRRVALYSDITQKKKSDELIWKQANFDPLTGLPNRQMFHDRLEQEIKKSHRTGLPLALIFIDLDRFKEVNDTLGHDMGDILLKDASRRLIGCVRETDTVARLGGDEFTIILGELNDTGIIQRVAREILKRLSDPFQLEDESAYVSCSIGITIYPQDAGDIETLIKNADQAMYAAKHRSRNSYSYFTQSMQDAAIARTNLVKDLRGALAAGEFRLVYQPIVELATGAINKAEALIRWLHPTRGLINPAEFIPIAKETGMLVEIGDWVFQQATSQAERWRINYRPTFQISINQSTVQFKSGRTTRAPWFEQMQHLGLPGQSIMVEITEELLVNAGSDVTDQLLALRDAGIEVSLDDFGTGYSSMSEFKKLDIDYIKIDQCFVQQLEANSDDLALCEAMIAMAHKLGMKVVAEGVETARQRELLFIAGCDWAQGYLFSKPLPAEEFEKLF